MFEDLIKAIETDKETEVIIYNTGIIPVLITAVNGKENGSLNRSEPYIKAIAKYVSDSSECFVLIKDIATEDTSKIKDRIIEIINENNIKLVIDLHSEKSQKDFDIELGTLHNLSADYSTIKELEDAFNEHGINNVTINETFSGGEITQKVYSDTGIDVVELEINKKFYNEPENIKKVCDSLIAFLQEFTNFN